ncbi:16S rRNA (cytosine(1402)-N(4))-methyltransferase RsmH [Planctomicrobium sp. SH661]|uniref:16S rRNA (cytosine(1402)-N(4))-methyltransferase RsmH n=1 Tax=Planctomicrobium sp. SH661 TaxID=3448124 RepID=UPI003F5CA0BA
MSSERTVHVPVMVHEVLDQLDLKPGLTIVDGTLGAGGHSQKILQQMDATSRLIGLDRDATMLARAAEVVKGPQVTIRQTSYAKLDRILDELGIDQVDRVLLDLGLSSDQLADPERGFGFETSGHLDMRFDSSRGIPAGELLRTAPEEELERIFREYGEDPEAKRLAQEIVSDRKRGRVVTTALALKLLVERLTPVMKNKSHPATRIFQALRIAVNGELEQLETFLHEVLPRRLRPEGRVLVITFHSLEDRLVKQAFRETTTWENLTRKPIVATPSEVRWNPRSRSAKLRVASRKTPHA